MHSSASTPQSSAFPGSAKGFIAARRLRRQRLTVPPQLRWARFATEPGRAPAFQLSNEGGAAAETSVVLFTTTAVVRGTAGPSGAVDGGEHWDFTLDQLAEDPAQPIRGYVVARGGDGRWFASTVDGRSATFRSRPDELGVLRTLGLRMPLSAGPLEGELLGERATA